MPKAAIHKNTEPICEILARAAPTVPEQLMAREFAEGHDAFSRDWDERAVTRFADPSGHMRIHCQPVPIYSWHRFRTML
jgi:hypothetical protein